MTIFWCAVAAVNASLIRDINAVRSATALAALLSVFAIPIPAAADDGAQCLRPPGPSHHERLAVCNREIASGKYRGRELARMHFMRAYLNGIVVEMKHMGEPDADKKVAAVQLPDLNETVRLAPEEPDYLKSRCRAYAELGNFSAALADCNTAIRMRANDSPANVSAAYAARGFLYSRQKQYDKAIADYTVAIERFPNNPTALYNRSCARRAKGDTAGANADLAAAKKLIPMIEEASGKCE